jgi:hypothetical protein
MGCWGRAPTLGHAPIRLNSIHSPLDQNMASSGGGRCAGIGMAEV